MKQTLLALSIATASLAITACNSNDNNAVQTPVSVTDAKIQAKQNAKIVPEFAAIKTIHDNLTDPKAKKAYDDTLKAGVAQSAQADMASWLDDLYANKDKTASAGVAGKLPRPSSSNPNRTIVVDTKAAEYGQLVKKGLIGAYQLKGAVAEAGKLRVAGADNAAVLANVTAYLLGDYAELGKGKGSGYKDIYPGNEFEKYLKVVANNHKNFGTIENDLYNALHAAKTNVNDNTKFSANIMKAIGLAQKTVAIRALYYLNAGTKLKANMTKQEVASVAHSVSEGLGMVYGLQYSYNPTTHKPYYTPAEAKKVVDDADFWDAAGTKAKLDAHAKELAKRFGIESVDYAVAQNPKK